MSTFAEQRTAAGKRYATTLAELRDAYAALLDFDRRAHVPSFGPPPDIIPFQHGEFTPDVGGGFARRFNDAA